MSIFHNLRRVPAFVLTVVAVMALGIGAATAVFSVVDRVLFRPPPYTAPRNIASVGIAFPIMEYDFLTASTYRELKRNMPPFQSVTSWSGVTDCDLTEHNPARLACARVESTFLPFFGIQPALGRNFTAEEDLPGVPRVALITHTFWKSRFSAQPAAIGRTLFLDGQPVTILGVLPESFELPNLDRADVVLPLALPVTTTTRAVRVFGRLKPGITAAQAVPMLASFYDFIFRTEAPPQFRNVAKLRVRLLREFQSGEVHAASWTLLAAVCAMLLIACASAANLLLARAAARRRDLAVRAALGASRRRLIREALAESMLLSLAGAAAGCLLAQALLRWFVHIAPAGIPHLAAAAIDARVLLFALAGALLCGLLCGLAPSLATPRPELLTGQRVLGGSGLRLRRALVGAQIAISLVLLTSAGLLLESLWKRRTLDLGLATGGAVTAEITPGASYRTPADRQRFFDSLHERFERLPGVRAVAHSDSLPPGGVARNQPLFILNVEGLPPMPRTAAGVVTWRSVSPSYFQTLGIPILKGRAFTEEDNRPNVDSIILSHSLARKLLPVEEALGRRIRRFPNAPWHTVIGIARDARNSGLGDANNPEYYVSRAASSENFARTACFVLRGDAPAPVIQSWIRSELAALDPTIPVSPRTLDDSIGELAARPRFNALLLSLFAALGLALAATGLYGLISYMVVQRSSEIGVRLALGASPAQVLRSVLAQALRWTSAGLLAGVIGALLAARALRGLLFHVSPHDPAPLAAAAAVLLCCAFLAALLPAFRAARLDPASTLRRE
ncbi:MAG: ABC transporter permease [Candidatus Solibacter usitatus]|nr:ABC transporter permease [Candidatus Solibacter usitatus]